MVYSKWLRSLKYGNDYFKLIYPTAYFRVYQKYIEAMLLRPGCVVRLAVLTEDPDVVLGFSISRAHILDYVHCHKDARRLGIATALCNFEITMITHLTKTGMIIWNKKLPKAVFNPFE